MSLIDNIRNFFSGVKAKEEQEAQEQIRRNEQFEKEKLANGIVDLVHQISRKNSFDSSILYLRNVSSYELMRRKSLQELKADYTKLQSKLDQLNEVTYKSNDDLNKAAWTGQKIDGLTDRNLDRYQRGEDGR